MARIRDQFSVADSIEQIARKRGIEVNPLFYGYDLIPGVLEVLGPSLTFSNENLLASDKTPESVYEEYNKPFVRQSIDEDDYDPKQ